MNRDNYAYSITFYKLYLVYKNILNFFTPYLIRPYTCNPHLHINYFHKSNLFEPKFKRFVILGSFNKRRCGNNFRCKNNTILTI